MELNRIRVPSSVIIIILFVVIYTQHYFNEMIFIYEKKFNQSILLIEKQKIGVVLFIFSSIPSRIIFACEYEIKSIYYWSYFHVNVVEFALRVIHKIHLRSFARQPLS